VAVALDWGGGNMREGQPLPYGVGYLLLPKTTRYFENAPPQKKVKNPPWKTKGDFLPLIC